MTSLSFSCNGSSLAVGYGKSDHVSWCEHQSVISLWNIFRRDFNRQKPHTSIDVPNCVTTLEFHPTNPLILAGGTVNGEIYVWNVDMDESKREGSAVVTKSEADEYFHREPIKKVVWMLLESADSFEPEVHLVSISGDGKVLVWKNPLKSLRYPVKGHLIARVKERELQILGGNSISMIKGQGSLEDQAFIVGTEGGMVQRCLLRRPEYKDVRYFLSNNPNVTWSEEAMNFLGNISDQRQLQKIKDLVDQYMQQRPPPRQVYANHIFGAKPPI